MNDIIRRIRFYMLFLPITILSMNAIAVEKHNVIHVKLNKKAMCSITAPPTYDVGQLTHGRKLLPPLYIDVNCNGVVKTQLTANVVKADPDGSGVRFLVNNIQDKNNPIITFKTKSSTGQIGTLTWSSPFCHMTSHPYVRSYCELTPEIYVPRTSSKGALSASVRFTLNYN